jgi:hypothetical protein
MGRHSAIREQRFKTVAEVAIPYHIWKHWYVTDDPTGGPYFWKFTRMYLKINGFNPAAEEYADCVLHSSLLHDRTWVHTLMRKEKR